MFLGIQRLNFTLVRNSWQECGGHETAERAHMFSEMIAFCCLTCEEFWEVNGANDRNRSVCLCSSWRGSYGEWGFTVTVFFLCRPFSIDRPQFLPLLRKQNKTKPLEDRFYILTFIKKVIIQFRVILFILV